MIFLKQTMDKLQITGENFGRVFNSRNSCVHALQLHFSEAEQQPNLKMKIRPKQPRGYLPLDIALPWQTQQMHIWQPYFCTN